MKLILLIVLVVEGYAPVKFDHDFGGEKFLRADSKDPDARGPQEGSGEDPDDVLTPDNLTSTVPQSTVATSRHTSPPMIHPSTPHPIFLSTMNPMTTGHPTTVATTRLSTTTHAKPPNCYDVSKRCSKVTPLCTREEYKNIMMRQCARTCNFCPQFVRLPHRARCRDAFHSCPIWARNGFCHSTFYTLEERATYCPKSCEAC